MCFFREALSLKTFPQPSKWHLKVFAVLAVPILLRSFDGLTRLPNVGALLPPSVSLGGAAVLAALTLRRG